MNHAIVGLKIGGVASLGILTGVHFNFSLETLRTILSLSSAPHAQKAFVTALGLFRSTVRPLELAATTSLITAWILSPRSGKHPYLWFASVPVAIGIAIERLKLSGVEVGVLTTQTVRSERGRRGTGAEVEINGEVVRGGLDNWRTWGLMRGAIIGAGFLMSLVGLYGDHFH